MQKSKLQSKNKKVLKEQFVKRTVLKYLVEKGFGDPKKKISDLRERGVDIRVQKLRPRPCGWYYLIECKGDPSESVKHPGGWRSSATNSAMGQIISRMHTNRKSHYGGYNYAVAFPDSFKNKVLKTIPFYVCNRLRLSIFLVDNKGNVEKYDHKKLRGIQNNYDHTN